eukprot:1143400-Pelagomonas_calceolata.AAC.4
MGRLALGLGEAMQASEPMKVLPRLVVPGPINAKGGLGGKKEKKRVRPDVGCSMKCVVVKYKRFGTAIGMSRWEGSRLPRQQHPVAAPSMPAAPWGQRQ